MKYKSSLKIWFIPFNAPLKVINKEEKIFSCGLNNYMKTRYTHSRGYIREVLSRLFLISPLEVPLINAIGKPPLLKESMGYLSLSYSLNNLIICWSLDKVGIDMENRFRNFNAQNLMDRFYFEEEKKNISLSNKQKIRESVLQYWVFKEASIKLIGGTIAKNLNQIEIINNKFAKNNLDGSYINLINLSYKDFLIGIASKNKDIYKESIICEY